MFRRCSLALGVVCCSPRSRPAQQGGSLPPRWAPCRKIRSFNSPALRQLFVAVDGRLSSLGSALSNWWNARSKRIRFRITQRSRAAERTAKLSSGSSRSSKPRVSNQNQGQPNFNGNVGINPRRPRAALRINKARAHCPTIGPSLARIRSHALHRPRRAAKRAPNRRIIDWIIRETDRMCGSANRWAS